MNERFWSTPDAARLSGLSVDMLNYLQRSGIVVSRKVASQQRVRGRPRAYTFSDILMLKAVGSLTAAGVSVLRLRRSIHAARRVKVGEETGAVEGRYLVTTGDDAHIVAEHDLARLLPSLGTTLLLIDLEQLRYGLLQSLNASPHEVS